MSFIKRLLGRDEEDEEETEVEEAESTTEEAAVEEDTQVEEEAPVEDEPVEAEDTPEVAAERGSTIPYHDSIIDRLKYMFDDKQICGCGIEGPDEFKLEFMAMGERFHFMKPANEGVSHESGTVSDEDVFIRISNDTVKELLGAATFTEFSDIYMDAYKNSEAGKFVKIELRKDITSLNRRGYARVPLLKLLIGAVR